MTPTIQAFIEYSYLIGGLVLPIFYLPQILRLLRDDSLASSFSLSKAFWQLLLRSPTLPFAIWVVNNNFMTVVLTFDLLGRCAELATALYALRRQGVTWDAALLRMLPFALGQRFVRNSNGQAPLSSHVLERQGSAFVPLIPLPDAANDVLDERLSRAFASTTDTAPRPRRNRRKPRKTGTSPGMDGWPAQATSRF